MMLVPFFSSIQHMAFKLIFKEKCFDYELYCFERTKRTDAVSQVK